MLIVNFLKIDVILGIKVVRLNEEIDGIKFIPKEQVPRKEKRTKWGNIFQAIPKGQAAVFTEYQISPSSARQALKRRQRRGLFPHLNIIIEGRKGERTVYIVNNEEN